MAASVKSVNTIIADMIREIQLRSAVTDVSEGSIIGSLIEAAALQDFQNQVAVLKVLESSNLQSLVGSDLDNKAQEMNIPNGIGGFGRIPAKRSTGTVKIGSPFTKKVSAIYIGKPAPFAGSVKIFVQDVTGWPSVGSIYIGRGTANEEGPIPYTSITNNNSYFTLNLNPSSPLVNNHSYSDSVILAQGGARTIPAGTAVLAPAAAGNVPVSFLTDSSALLLDGESDVSVAVTCSVFGEDGNISANAIKAFSALPFTGATVTNEAAISNGSSAEADEALRNRIKNYVATLARGTKTAISSALLGLRDPETGKTITSLNIVEPATISEPSKAYIDDGSGFEPTLNGQDFEQLLRNASGQEILFRTSNFPVAPCTAVGTRNAPYSLADGMYLDVELDGVVERYRINSSEYVNLLSVSVPEIVRSFNSQETNSGTQKIGFRTSNEQKTLSVFDLSGTAERLRILPSELQILLGLPTTEIRPLFLYQDNQILSFKGATAVVQSALYPWTSLSSGDLQNVGIKVDGVAQYFTIDNSDFSSFGSTISNATLDQWAVVFKRKVAGINVYAGGGRLVFATWQENSSAGSVEILNTLQNGSPASWIGVNKLFSTNATLSSVGSESQYEFNRLSGQIKLKNRPNQGSSLTIASQNTRAEILCKETPTGVFSIAPNSFGTGKLVVAADGEFAIRSIPVSGSVSITPSIVSANQNLVQLDASESTLFADLKINDFIYIAPDTSVANKMTNRLNSFYRIRRKGLNTRAVNSSFTNADVAFSAPVSGVVTVTVTTAASHALLVGQKVDIQSLVLSPVDAPLNAAASGIHTVTAVNSATQFEYEIPWSAAVSAGPNTATVFVAKDAWIAIEVSDLQRQAFFGLFTDVQVSYSMLSSLVQVKIPSHSLTGGSIVVNSLSPALASVFVGVIGIPGPKPITAVVDQDTIEIDLGVPATGVAIPGPITLSGQYTTVYSSYDVTTGMLSGFKCEGAFPQIIDLGSLPSQTVDQVVSSINTAIGVSGYKLSPRQLAIRSNSFDPAVSNVAVLAVSGPASVVFDPAVSSGIQSHTAFKLTKRVNNGAPILPYSQLPTEPNAFYPTRGAVKFSTTGTIIKNEFTNPDIEQSDLSYPKGLQEIGISGRNFDAVTRVYNNSLSAPFSGFARGSGVIKPLAQSINGTNADASSVGIRAADLPLAVDDKLVVEMDLDLTNKTTAIPMYKLARIETMQAFNAGSGSQIEFTLKDPDDEITLGNPRPFFDLNSPYRNFDLTDFNILFKPTVLHTIYPSLPFVGNPSDALILRSTQYGSAHELRFGMILPSAPSISTISVTHKSYEENSRVIEVVNASLKSGAKIVGSDFSGVYSITPAFYTSPTGAEIVQLTISALSINLSGVFQVDNILAISGPVPYAGGFLIIATPDPDTIVVSAPGISAVTMPTVIYDGSTAPISSFPVDATTVQEIKDALDLYFTDNPIFTAALTASTNPSALVRYPSYHTHGSSVRNNNITTISQSLDYHSKRAYFGSIAHIHTYDPINNRIVALVQNPEPVLPIQADIVNTGFPTNYADQECALIPANAKALEKWMNFTAVSPFVIQGSAQRVQSENNIQISSLNLGSAGAVRVTGVSANSVSSVVKAAPFQVGGSLKIRTDFATAKSFQRDALVSIQNLLPAPILRPYRSIPANTVTTGAVTNANTVDVNPWFRASTNVAYSRPTPGIARFTFRKSASGVQGGDTVAITKVSPFIAKLEITAGTGLFSARVGDMLILRGSQVASGVSYTSIFNTANQCVSSIADTLDQYTGYPVVHVESTKIIYVIAPNVTTETVTARDTVASGTFTASPNGFGQLRFSGVSNASSFSVGDAVEITSSVVAYNTVTRVVAVGVGYVDFALMYSAATSGTVTLVRNTTEFMFVPMLKAEKNIKTNYQAGAPRASNWLISPSEASYYRVKDLGNGIGYADFAFSSHDDMQLEDMSVSSGDWIQFSNAFNAANRGRFRLIAHNGKNAFIFKNDTVVDEVISTAETVIDGAIGQSLWRIGPKTDADISTSDKRIVRVFDGDSVFEQDKIVISSPGAGVTDWFDASVIGSWTISTIGLDRDFDVFCEAIIPGASSVSKTVLIGNASLNSISFSEGTPFVGYKRCIGYAHSDASSEAELFMMPQTSAYKINPAYGSSLRCEFKFGVDAETTIGVDGYKYYSGLIAEAHRVIDGSSSNTIAYPGVRAAGTAIEVQAPLIKSVTLALGLESRDGVSLNAIKNPVKSVITTYVNGLGVAKEIVLSEITKRVQNVPGVKSVTIISTFPAADDGVIKVGSFEVPRISNPDDILI